MDQFASWCVVACPSIEVGTCAIGEHWHGFLKLTTRS